MISYNLSYLSLTTPSIVTEAGEVAGSSLRAAREFKGGLTKL